MKKLALLLLLTICYTTIYAYQRFTIRLEPSTLTSPPAVHSGVFGEYNGKWFFIGGRKNGLHGFQPPFAFPTNNVNNLIYVVDPATDQRWTAPVNTLPDNIREPITSSNMQFYLNDSMLYMVGGYGWKDSIQNFVTWPTLTAVNMNRLMDAVINAKPIDSLFRQITDSSLAICGAHLAKLDSTYYLIFGHRFDGYYDRSDTTGFFEQQYSNQIRKFKIADDGTNLSLYDYKAVTDTNNFHRRDYNLLPMYDVYRGDGFLVFGGVFRKNANLPFFTPIEIFKDTALVRNDFNQNLSQYHSAVCALNDSAGMLQHDLFFGGMSMYYTDTVTQTRVTDSLIPFVRTISNVARDLDFNYHEIDAGIQMPALLGTNAYFMYEPGIPMFRQKFVHLNKLPRQQRLGYILGGIESPELNISDTDPSLSFASTRVFEVYLDTIEVPTAITEISNTVLNYIAYPNPAEEKITIEFELPQAANARIELLDMKGALVKPIANQSFNGGKQKLLLNVSDIAKGVYNCVITVNGTRKSIRLQKD